jgi:thiosulfate dehydrogenase
MERKCLPLSFAALSIALALLVAGCSLQEGPHRDSVNARPATGGAWNAADWRPPVVDSTPDDAMAAAVYRGLTLVSHTHDSLPRFARASLSCASCHLDDGRNRTAMPLLGAVARYPAYSARDDVVTTIEDRVNNCFIRSLAGEPLPSDSRDMHDMVAYLAFISRGVPQGADVREQGLTAIPAELEGDSTRGHSVYEKNCARCHGTGGGGMGAFPPLWGAASYSVGASMARRHVAAAFIRRNMPFDTPGVLTDQQALDVATYVTSMPRPDTPGKADDWPRGDTPADAPYATRGHAAFHPPRILERATLDQH